MNNVGSGSVSEMINSSVAVVTRPSVATFEMFERRGNLTNALIYVALGAVVTGLLGAIASPMGVIGGIITGVISTIVSFLVFTYAVFFIGKSQGGTGTYDEVAYTFSLFSVPLAVIGAVVGVIGRVLPLLGCIVGLPISLVLLAAQIYFGYLAVQSSMNLRESGKAIITLVVAAILTFIVGLVIAGVFAAIFGTAAALTS
jgi:hypothetical protein